ncbi:hypothetical protein DL89DRAFT_264546 [Linderina pennispora]|uniref:E3 ubiquitin-protein ligase PEP5 n=1 Tax=Linderina pennispora TaxID=61395 RepID=A0A1Y1WMK1_9FUNG|nr:uncharacterized protein DL89DRAFT_264546 [Linderina pennispora]ORX74743.1 hypothetical protein DL89DRAFT_264546 [Linderina pennispora]
MANFQLRQFHFFKRDTLGSLPEVFSKPELLLASNSGDLIFLADADGYIHIVNRSLIVKSFSRMLLTIEENVNTAATRPVIKLWAVDRLLRQGDTQPVAVKYQQPSTTPYPLTAVAATPSIGQIALGFAGGHIVLIRGNIAKGKATKQRTLHLAPEPITNLHFSTDDTGTNVALFATTTAQTLVFDTASSSGARAEPNVLEERGCGIGCSMVNAQQTRPIYFYTADGRGPCFAFDAPKVLLRHYKHYLLLATAVPSAMAPNLLDTGSAESPVPQPNSPSDSKTYSYNDATTFTILDTRNKLVAYTGVVAGGVRGVAAEWGSVFVLGGHGTLDHFNEKDLLEKLDTLYRQNLYPLAVKMAQNGNYDQASVAGIYKKYGDWLYNKDEFDSAMSQYTQTIGYVEPSYDAQRLASLAGYLQELHAAGMASADHTTLLLNCYTKLRDEERLDKFIHTQEDFQFDIDTAIHVCRQAGFYSQALQGMYLKLKVEDQEDIEAALVYMRKLNDADISVYLAEFGRRCLASLPKETTELLVDADNESETGSLLRSLPSSALSLRKIQHLFADQPSWLVAFLESIIAKRWQDPSSLISDEERDMQSAWNTLLELYLCGVESPLQHALELLRNPSAQIDWDRAYILYASALLDLYIEEDDVANMQKLLVKHGEQQPDLYVKALHYFAANPQHADNEQSLAQCLATIERHNLMSPLRVLQALGGDGESGVTLGMRQIETTTQRIAQNEKDVVAYAADFKKHHSQMLDLQTKPVVFQSTKCSSCMAPLDLPSVHFMCKHSFHQRCLGDETDSCIRCKAQNQRLEDERLRQETNSKKHAEFFDKLQSSDDGFDVIASWYSMSPFANVKLVDQ